MWEEYELTPNNVQGVDKIQNPTDQRSDLFTMTSRILYLFSLLQMVKNSLIMLAPSR